MYLLFRACYLVVQIVTRNQYMSAKLFTYNSCFTLSFFFSFNLIYLLFQCSVYFLFPYLNLFFPRNLCSVHWFGKLFESWSWPRSVNAMVIFIIWKHKVAPENQERPPWVHMKIYRGGTGWKGSFSTHGIDDYPSLLCAKMVCLDSLPCVDTIMDLGGAGQKENRFIHMTPMRMAPDVISRTFIHVQCMQWCMRNPNGVEWIKTHSSMLKHYARAY